MRWWRRGEVDVEGVEGWGSRWRIRKKERGGEGKGKQEEVGKR